MDWYALTRNIVTDTVTYNPWLTAWGLGGWRTWACLLLEMIELRAQKAALEPTIATAEAMAVTEAAREEAADGSFVRALEATATRAEKLDEEYLVTWSGFVAPRGPRTLWSLVAPLSKPGRSPLC